MFPADSEQGVPVHYDKKSHGNAEPATHPDANVARPGAPPPPKPLSKDTIRRINEVVKEHKRSTSPRTK